MDFGQVCLRSVSSKDLMIVNNLNSFIHVVVEVSAECLVPRDSELIVQHFYGVVFVISRFDFLISNCRLIVESFVKHLPCHKWYHPALWQSWP